MRYLPCNRVWMDRPVGVTCLQVRQLARSGEGNLTAEFRESLSNDDKHLCVACFYENLMAQKRILANERRRLHRESTEKRFICAVCDKQTYDLYTLRDEVWLGEAGFTKKENAHIQCVQSRLGRPLVLEDFTDAPVNNVVRLLLLGQLG